MKKEHKNKINIFFKIILMTWKNFNQYTNLIVILRISLLIEKKHGYQSDPDWRTFFVKPNNSDSWDILLGKKQN